MPRRPCRGLPLIMVLGLATCKMPQPVHQAVFVPPPPTKPTDRAPICAHPDELNAFHLVGLQTQLMQIAVTCGGDDKYDAFVRTYQPQLEAQRTILKSFFTRADGRFHAQSAYDTYVTQLADAESQHDLASGDQFCRLSGPTLDQAKAISSDHDLASFVAGVPVQQSLDVQACGTPGAPPATPPVQAASHRRRWYHHKKK